MEKSQHTDFNKDMTNDSTSVATVVDNAINLLVISVANCTAFSSLSSSRFSGEMVCCLLASLTFSVATSN